MRYLTSIGGVFALLLLLSGCGSNPSENTEKSDSVVETDSPIKETDDAVEEEESKELLIDDFPKDLFIPENAILTERTETDENSIMLTYEVPGLLVDDQDIYKDFLTDKNYTINEINMSDQMIVFQGRKLGDHFAYYHLVGQEENSYTLSIEYGEYE